MSMVLLRGRLLSFRRAPLAIDDTQSYLYVEDGGLLIEDGRIVAIGDYADIRKQAPEDIEEKDHRPHLIVPGLIDMHVHLFSTGYPLEQRLAEPYQDKEDNAYTGLKNAKATLMAGFSAAKASL